ncbi:MAG: hypothetical protein SPF41_08545 [Candidatus Merdousia sp.]|nr:hypothetical protein [Candidatus Merdousia sp.]
MIFVLIVPAEITPAAKICAAASRSIVVSFLWNFRAVGFIGCSNIRSAK